MEFSAEDREILLDFVNEGVEGLEKAESILLKLENSLTSHQSNEQEFVDELFRIFHSIKGSAGFLELKLIGELTHLIESLLDHFRRNELELSKEHTELLLEACDELHAIFYYLKRTLSEAGYQGNFKALSDRIKAAISHKSVKTDEKNTAEQDSSDEQSNPLSQNSLADKADLVEQFSLESTELMDVLEQNLLKLEKNSTDIQALQNVFNALTELNAKARELNFNDIVEISRQASIVFNLAGKQKIKLTGKQISLILKIIDFLRLAVANLNQGKAPTIPGKLGLIDLLKEMAFVADNQGQHSEVELKRAEPRSPKVEKKLEDIEKKLSNNREAQKANEVVRVDVEKLNRLMDLVGEIVIAETMVSQHPAFNTLEMEGLDKAIAYLQKNIRELQDLATSMRMIPLNGLFAKMRRLVRDISLKRDKQVELEVAGGENEVDRSVIEHISDPLVHILRNAIDHGIESPEERKANGKPQIGHILLKAVRVGGEIWIEIKDDGRGLDREKILKRAKERGLIPANRQQLSNNEIYNLIFKAGFSTADKVTNISGRGVGMDVVKKNVEKMRGHISIQSTPGQGTTIYLKIPLTTAIIEGMLMRADETIYAIPMQDICEALHIEDRKVVELIDGQEVIKIREEIIPIIRLDNFYNSMSSYKAIEEGIVVVAKVGEKVVGLWVQEILGQQQLVLKPVPQYLGKLDGVSACAVLGDGNICLVLDLNTMLQIAEGIEY
ncbi:MAG TPA: chemotaxis protein CheA [Caldithrix abyssi]|uniref:Chemotaxis protein CheA n=1 Tax=Caldithrix abyssi TaxID=187145 RepID=A0A7V5H4U7_CALAY|nr:chemotaxis protein CheA [Caldithrix abyssi]